MTEQNQTPDTPEDTEGHRYSNDEGLGDAAGLDSTEDDTKGHSVRFGDVRGTQGADDADDTEGHSKRFYGVDDSGDEDDDTEGHLRVK